MKARFHDRTDAGRCLARSLAKYAGTEGLLVLALPRGGVPVAFEVARSLNAPLDVLVVRKLGVPGHEELAMGAIASGGVRVVNEEVVGQLGITGATLEAAVAREAAELRRRERAYRGDRPFPKLNGRTVIVVDDGIATGSTMVAAVRALRGLGAARVIAASPTVAPPTAEGIRREADDLVAVIMPADFAGVGQWYDDFTQTTDGEVRDLMAKAAAPRG